MVDKKDISGGGGGAGFGGDVPGGNVPESKVEFGWIYLDRLIEEAGYPPLSLSL